jgi:fermentation-respiration switch protein FrsA (DUF1100 family)
MAKQAEHPHPIRSSAKNWRKIFAYVFIIVLLLVGSGVILLCKLQADSFVYSTPESRLPIEKTPSDYNLSYKDIVLTTQDQMRLSAWYIPSKNRSAIVLIHGYGTNKAQMLTRAEILVNHGYGVLLLDLRAHGQSDGNKITFGLLEVSDLKAAVQFLASQPDVDPDRIGVLGASMGGVVAILEAVENTYIKALVTESAPASLPDQIATSVTAYTGLPAFPFANIIQWFAEGELGYKAEEVAAVKVIGSISPRPILILQGGADKFIPQDSGRRLHDAAGEPRELWFEPDLGHLEFLKKLPDDYKERVVKFFDQYLLQK